MNLNYVTQYQGLTVGSDTTLSIRKIIVLYGLIRCFMTITLLII